MGDDGQSIAPALEVMGVGQPSKPLRARRRLLALAALVMNPGYDPECDDSRHVVSQSLCKSIRVANGSQRLIGVAEQPAVYCRVIPAAGARIVAGIRERVGGMPGRVVERDSSLGMGEGGRGLSHGTGGRPQGMIRLDQPTGVLPSLGVA